jgi:uncharacterized protein
MLFDRGLGELVARTAVLVVRGFLPAPTAEPQPDRRQRLSPAPLGERVDCATLRASRALQRVTESCGLDHSNELDVATICSYSSYMRYEWDEAKRLSNIQKHGIDFVGIEKVFAGTTLTILDDRFDYGESRFITLGLLSGRVVVIAHAETPQAIRIISVRKATKNEEASYFKEIAH